MNIKAPVRSSGTNKERLVSKLYNLMGSLSVEDQDNIVQAFDVLERKISDIILWVRKPDVMYDEAYEVVECAVAEVRRVRNTYRKLRRSYNTSVIKLLNGCQITVSESSHA